MNSNKDNEPINPTLNKGDVICSIRVKNPNFKQEVFEKKILGHIKCGYTRELAEWKVLGDFNRAFFNFMGIKPNKQQTDSEGYYI